jgi:universal stress protein A
MGHRYLNILAPIDMSPIADTVATRAGEIAERNGAELTLMHVVEVMPPMGIDYPFATTSTWHVDEQELVKLSKDSIAKLAERTGVDKAHQEVRVGYTKTEIVRFAREQGHDLIVLGTHGRHGIDRLLGSTANAVIHDAPCDVLCIRVHEEKG